MEKNPSRLQHDGTCLLHVARDFSLLHFVPERLVRMRRTNVRSMRWNGEKTMVSVSDQSVARGMSHVQSCKPLKKVTAKGAS